MRIHFRESPVDKIHPNRIVHKGLQITMYSYTREGLSKPLLWSVVLFTVLNPSAKPLWGKCEHYQRTVN